MKAPSGPVSTRPAESARSPAPAPTAVAPPAHDGAPQPLSALQRNLVSGAALPASLRTRMESGFGTSFADVRVHTGGAAAQATGRMRAEALTSGHDIAFAPGRYRPGSKAGDSLIAHELAHVVQQRHSGGGGTVQAKSAVSNPGDAAESAADTAAATVLAGGRARLGAAGQSLRGQIMRRALAGAAPFAAGPCPAGRDRAGGGAGADAGDDIAGLGGGRSGVRPDPARRASGRNRTRQQGTRRGADRARRNRGRGEARALSRHRRRPRRCRRDHGKSRPAEEEGKGRQ